MVITHIQGRLVPVALTNFSYVSTESRDLKLEEQ